MILWTATYVDDNEKRMEELLHCLEKNIANREISTIQLVLEEFSYSKPISKKHWELMDHPKVHLIKLSSRMKFNDWFEMATNLSERVPNNPNIIANSDIYFDETLKLLTLEYLSNRFVCLSRRHAAIDQVGIPPVDLQAPCAQDAWAFVPPLKYKPVFDFTTGCRGCDNRVAFEMSAAGYQVVNPCKSVHAFHVHASRVVHYGPAVPGPHMNVNPVTI